MLRTRITRTHASSSPCIRPRLRALCSRGAVQVRRAESQPPEDIEQRFSLAPSKPATPFGQMLGYILEKQPELFKSAIEDQFLRLKDEKDARERQQQEQSSSEATEATESKSTGLVLTGLSDRIQEVKDAENRATVEDLMYMCILEEFMKLGVTMLPPAENYTDVPTVNLQPLMEDVHTNQAMDLVREHLMGMMGQAALVPSTTVMKTSKLQMLQVYMFSAMFGYYLRRVDQRFQLAQSAGFVPEDPEDAIERLERLFTLESDPDEMDSVSSTVEMPKSPESSEDSSPKSESSSKATKEGKKSALRRYIDSFDAETTKQMTSVMSLEAAKLLNRQSKALWGDLEELTVELREAVGQVTSAEEAQEAFQNAIAHDQVQTVTMFASTQRRAVLEAVAFGTFVRDTEMYVDNNFSLLTPNPNQGMGLLGPGADEDGPEIEI